jgi:hypothetical protein
MNSLLSIGRPSLLHLPIIPGIYQVPGKGGAGRNLSIDGLSPSNNNISTVNLQNGESYNQQENKSSSHIIGHLGDSKFTDSVIKANKALIGEATSENGNNGIPFVFHSIL